MTLLSPALRRRLARSKLDAGQAVARSGIGERRSRAKGVGLEFADHRPYQPGDDIRHLDQHVYARLNEHYIRQFSLYQQLEVSLLLDTSASMRFGEPEKFAFARAVAAGLGYVALAGGDALRVGAFSAADFSWSGLYRSLRHVPELFHWLSLLEPKAQTDFAKSAQLALAKLKPESLLIIVSDWLSPEVEKALKVLTRKRQSLVAIHILAPQELEPERLGEDALRLVDSETGQMLDLSLDEATLKQYQAQLQSWTSDLRSAVYSLQGQFLQARSDTPLEQLFLRDWRTAGLIR